MGYGVYWHKGRWQGYGVPAYCDYKDCKEKIDRGLGCQNAEDKENGEHNIFCCDKHESEPIEDFDIDYKKEHPEWLNHVLNHESWKEWREENPEIVKIYTELLEETKLDGKRS